MRFFERLTSESAQGFSSLSLHARIRVSFDNIAHQDHINVAHKIAHQGKRYKWGGGGGRRGERGGRGGVVLV
eukprot:gene20383-biopygen23562